jgi:hypothetical protein
MDWIKGLVTYIIKLLNDLVVWLIGIVRQLIDLIYSLIAHQRVVHIEFWTDDGRHLGGKDMPAEDTLHNNAKRHYAITFLDDDGEPAPVDGRPDVKMPDSDVATISIDDDGMGFMLFGKNAPSDPHPDAVGDTTVKVTADVDLGDGFKALSDSLLVHVIAAAPEEATAMKFTPGAEEPL